jgi:anti-sigma B factor antagonist
MSSETRQNLRVTVVNDVAVVGFEGRNAIFHAKDVDQLSDDLLRLVEEEGRTKMLLSLSGIQYLSSAMLVKLIALKKRIEEAQGRLKLCGLSPVLCDIFRVSKLDHLFEIENDEASALANF